MTRLVAYLWLGMVLGVSFLATPIKFTAKSLTMPVALDVGRATFHAFGKVEWQSKIAGLLSRRLTQVTWSPACIEPDSKGIATRSAEFHLQ